MLHIECSIFLLIYAWLYYTYRYTLNITIFLFSIYMTMFKGLKAYHQLLRSISLYSLFLILLLCSAINTIAQGNLLITPKRVVFDGSKRFHELNLANTGKDTARYQISFVQIRMTENGSFEKITEADSGQYFANKYLRVFPRTVTLAPNEAQVVKIQVTKTANLTAGEYRSHLHFRSISNVTPLGDRGLVKDSVAGVSIRLMPVFGITIPIIIRVGENTSKASLSGLSLDVKNNSKPTLDLSLKRSGSMSVYGDLTVNHISHSGKVTQVGLVKGISVYTPNKLRKVKVNLNQKAGIDFHIGKLQVVYTAEGRLKTEKLAEAEIQLH